jgi:hypothetical protein
MAAAGRELPRDRNSHGSRSERLCQPKRRCVRAQKDLDENWTVDAGGGYWINPGDRNFWISGVLLQRKLGEALVVGAEVFHRTPNTTDGLALTGLNVGATYDFSEHHHLLVSAGRGLRNASAADQFTWFLGFEFTN